MITLEDNHFKNCSAFNDGGALSLKHNNDGYTQVEMSNTLFEWNSAAGNGGAIASSYRTIVLKNVTFQDNKAKNGGALSMAATRGDVAVRFD